MIRILLHSLLISACLVPNLTSVVPPPLQTAPPKLALLVGVGRYDLGAHPDDGWGRLETLPDVVGMKRLLTQTYRFDEVRSLFDEQADQANVVNGFRTHLIAKAKPGSAVVFYFTGHGHQARNQPANDPEPDGLDEALILWLPKDKRSAPSAERARLMYLLDDTMATLLTELRTKMTDPATKQFSGSITFIADSCHAGSVNKGPVIPKGRPWKEEIDGPMPPPSAPSKGATWDGSESLPEGVITISGCESGQSSYMMEKEEDGSTLTYYLIKGLTESATASSNISYRDVFERVRASVAGQRPNQNPQLDGNVDALIFGDGSAKSPERHIGVTGVVEGTKDVLLLTSGSISGLTVGSELQINRSGTELSDKASVLGLATVDWVGPFAARAKFSPAKGAVAAEALAGARAFLTQYSAPVSKLEVAIEPDHPLRSQLTALPFVTIKNPKDASWGLRITETANRWQRKTGEFFDVKGDLSKPDVLKERLLAEWRWQELSTLATPVGSPPVDVAFVFVEKGKKLAAGEEVPDNLLKKARRSKAGGYLMVPEDVAYLVCRNRSNLPLHVTAIYLMLDGSIATWPANPFAQQAVAGDGKWRALVPFSNVAPPWGTEVVKVVATPRQVDLSGVALAPKDRPASKSGDSNLRDLLLGLADGNPKSGKMGFGDDGEPFTVASVAFTTAPKG